MAADVAAVVVNYNSGDHLAACVRSLRADGVTDVVVIDNDSRDASLATLAEADTQARVLRQGENLGYGAGANRGVVATDARYLLVINPDTIVEPGTVKALSSALDRDPGLGIVGPRIEDRDGTLYPSGREFPRLGDAIGHAFLVDVVPNNRFTRRYRMLDWDRQEARRVDWVSGACFLVRRTAFEAVGGFDEAYFMYLEEVDLCWRLGQAGWAAGYEPGGAVMHVQGVSTARTPYRMLLAHHRSMFRFWWRTSSPGRRLLAPLVLVGLVVRGTGEAGRRAVMARRVKENPRRR